MTAVLRQLNVLDIVLQFIHPCKVHRLQTQYIFIYHMYVIKYICHYIYRTRNKKNYHCLNCDFLWDNRHGNIP